ncbi:MAG: hypothetical protein HFI67_11815 [Lachnospiraceae bacterium]|jgi:hypothetical protein|nr:hypothetical protein [Lachnospiraceae bacterium]
MRDSEKVKVTIEVFLEIRDSEAFGGAGSTGYTGSRLSGNDKMLTMDLEDYLQAVKKDFANMFQVSPECVRLITEGEYELCTSEEDGWGGEETYVPGNES